MHHRVRRPSAILTILTTFTIFTTASPRGTLNAVKLLRFELASAPGYTRSGIIYGGKVYETDGTNAVGVHEWQDVVPFIPTGQPPSYRIFRLPEGELDAWEISEDSRPMHSYLNPGSLIAPNRQIPMPVATDELSYEPQLGLITAAGGANLTVQEADGYVLGLTIVLTLVARDIERIEKKEGWGPGRSRDFGTAVGPFITTPEELDDIVVDDSRGRRYRFGAVIRVNSEEVGRQDLTELLYTPAELVSFASETCPLVPGDLITLGPIGMVENTKKSVGPGDEIHVTIERLGTLVTKIV